MRENTGTFHQSSGAATVPGLSPLPPQAKDSASTSSFTSCFQVYLGQLRDLWREGLGDGVVIHSTDGPSEQMLLGECFSDRFCERVSRPRGGGRRGAIAPIVPSVL